MVSDPMTVEVAYARPDKQSIIELKVAPGTTLAEAIEQSGITKHFPEIGRAHV